MSEIIRLKVPASVTEDYTVNDPETGESRTETRTIEFVSHGNLSAELKPKTQIKTKSRAFADHLIGRYGLTEIVETADGDASDDDADENAFESQYAADFPYRKIFIDLGMPIETVRGLNREQLIGVKGIGEKAADAVLNYQPAPPVLQNNEDNGGDE